MTGFSLLRLGSFYVSVIAVRRHQACGQLSWEFALCVSKVGLIPIMPELTGSAYIPTGRAYAVSLIQVSPFISKDLLSFPKVDL